MIYAKTDSDGDVRIYGDKNEILKLDKEINHDIIEDTEDEEESFWIYLEGYSENDTEINFYNFLTKHKFIPVSETFFYKP